MATPCPPVFRLGLIVLLSLGCAPAQPHDTKRLATIDWFAETEADDPAIWGQYRREPSHSGTVAPGVRLGVDLALTYQSAPYAIGDYSASKSSPTVVGELVYVGVDDGRLLALDRQTGGLVWSFATHRAQVESDQAADDPTNTDHHGIHGTAALADGRVFIGDYSGWLYALDAFDGSLLWEVDLGGSIGASPVLWQGHIFMAVEFPDPDGQLFIVEQRTGAVVWQSERLGNHPHSSVSLDTERAMAFLGANNGRFFAWDLSTGENVWTARMGLGDSGDPGEIKSTAAVDSAHGSVWVTSWDKALHGYDVETGAELLSYFTEGRIMSSPSFSETTLYVGSQDRKVHAVDRESGLAIWTRDLGGSINGSPTLLPEEGNLVVGSSTGTIQILSMETGEELWDYGLGSVMSGVPTVLDGQLYAFGADGITWRFDRRD